jgi:hypothetical protein
MATLSMGWSEACCVMRETLPEEGVRWTGEEKERFLKAQRHRLRVAGLG